MLTNLLNTIQTQLRNWRGYAVTRRDQAAAGTLTSFQAINILENAESALQLMARVPRDQDTADRATVEWDYSGTIGTDFTAIETAIKAVGDWIQARDDAIWTGFSIGLYDSGTQSWPINPRVFTNSETSGLQTELNNVIAAIDTFLGNIQIN